MNNILETNITKFCKLVKDINNKNEVMECKLGGCTDVSTFLDSNSKEVSEFMQKQEELRELLNEITKKKLVTIPFEEFKSRFDAGKLNIPPYHLTGIGTTETQEIIKKANEAELKYESYSFTCVDGLGECIANDVCYEICVGYRVRGCRNYILRIYSDNKLEVCSEEIINKTITYCSEPVKYINILSRTKIV